MKKTIAICILLLIIACTQTAKPNTNQSDATKFDKPETTIPAEQEKITEQPKIVPEKNETNPESVKCISDVKECPDGSYVAREPPKCEFAQCPANKITTEATMAKNTMIEIQTTMGTMKIKLFDDKAPKTVENFKKLVEKGFYDGTIFHRVISNFMIQGGDPEGTGMGGPGYTIQDEFGAGLQHDKKGMLSMANSGPNTGGSQFFITLKATPWLDGKHAVFGELVEGMDVLDKIGNTLTDRDDKPRTEVKIVKAKIVGS